MKREIKSVLLAASLIASANADILHDWTFNETDGTLMPAVSDDGTLTDVAWSANINGADVQGNAYDIRRNGTGTNQSYANIVDISSGQIWIGMDLFWSFEGGSTGENVKIGVATANFSTGGSELAAVQLTGTRDGNRTTTLTGYANEVAPGADIPGLVIETGPSSDVGGSNGTYNFVLGVDLDNDTYEIWYRKDFTGAYTQLGTTTATGDGTIRSLYVDVNGTMTSNPTENFSIDRIFITDVNPIPEPSTFALVGLTGLAALFAIRRRR